MVFRLTDLDLTLPAPWREGNTWPHGDDAPWTWLYHLGTLPALLAVLAALFVLLAGFRSAGWQRLRRASVYLVLAMAVGPGLLANAVLKDHWGRPRPRDVIPLGGLQPFEPILTMDPTSPGKSFPCGHATMGFFFLAFYFVLRRERPGWARTSMALAFVSGLAIGWARVVQGGHFPSDVLWAGGIVWLVCALLARWLRPEMIPAARTDFQPLSWPKLAGFCLLVPLLCFLGLLATPIDGKESFAAQAGGRGGPVEFRLQVPLGTTRIEPGEAPSASVRTNGFGLPGSGIKSLWKESPQADGDTALEFKQRLSGLRTEIDQDLVVCYPADRTGRIRLAQERGSVRLVLPSRPATEPRRWIIELGAGDVLVRTTGQPVRVRVGDLDEHNDPAPSDDVRIEAPPGVRVRVEEGK